MDVDRLRDLMVLHMRPVWEEKHWRELDANVRVLEVKGTKHSPRLCLFSMVASLFIHWSSHTLFHV